ncbi:MAG: NUDIX hydrolase [Gemmatimonadota bacterium]
MSNQPKLDSRRIHTGRVLNLDIDHVRFPDGSTGELEMIRHSGASAILPVLTTLHDPAPRLLLIRQYRYAAEGRLYEVPAGRLDPAEIPEECARRELREETGCTAQTIRHLTTIYTTPGFTDERIHLFVAEGLTAGETRHEPDEFLETVETSLSEALAMVESGGIVDAKTATLILLAGRIAGM